MSLEERRKTKTRWYLLRREGEVRHADSKILDIVRGPFFLIRMNGGSMMPVSFIRSVSFE